MMLSNSHYTPQETEERQQQWKTTRELTCPACNCAIQIRELFVEESRPQIEDLNAIIVTCQSCRRHFSVLGLIEPTNGEVFLDIVDEVAASKLKRDAIASLVVGGMLVVGTIVLGLVAVFALIKVGVAMAILWCGATLAGVVVTFMLLTDGRRNLRTATGKRLGQDIGPIPGNANDD